MPTQEDRTEASRRLLIDAALRIIGSAGLRALTATRIEAVSGASRGLVGYHFGSKDGLIEAVIRQAHQIIAAIPEAADAGGSNGAAAVRETVRGYLEQLGRNPEGHRAILILMAESVSAQPQLHESIRALNAVLRDGLRGQFDRGLDDGSIRADIDAATEAFIIASLLRGIALQWLVEPTIDLAAATARTLTLVERGYAARA
jgi:AcrR family transcriptional regulator